MNENAVDAIGLGHPQQGVEVILMRVYAAIGKQSEDVQAASAAARVLHGGKQCCVAEEVAILDHEVDLGDVHVNDAAGADVEVSNFAVPHLTGGQTDIASAGVDESVGIIAQQ